MTLVGLVSFSHSDPAISFFTKEEIGGDKQHKRRYQHTTSVAYMYRKGDIQSAATPEPDPKQH